MRSISINFILATVVCLLLSCKKQTEYLPVPADAEVIIKVNGNELFQKVLWDKVSDLSLSDLFQSAEEDTTQKSPGELLFSNPGDAGLDYLNEFYLHKKNGVFFLTIHVNDFEELKEFLEKEIKIKVATENQYYYASCNDFSIGFTKQFAVFYPPNNSDIDLQTILNLSKEKSVFATSFFPDTLNTDISFTANSKILLKDYFPIADTLSAQILSERIFGTINFEEGKIKIEANHLLKPLLESALLSIDNKELSSIATKDFSAIATLKINPDFFPKVFSDLSKQTIRDVSIGTLLITEFKGEINFNLSELKDTIKTFTSYQLDEDFNTTAVTDTQCFFYPIFNLDLPLKNDSLIQRLLISTHMVGKHEGHFDGKSTFNFTFNEVPIYFKTQTTNLSISSDKNFLQTSNKVDNTLNVNATGIYAYMIPANLNKETQNYLSQIRDITIWGERKKAIVVLRTEVKFADEKQNGLVALIKFIKDFQSQSKVEIRL